MKTNISNLKGKKLINGSKIKLNMYLEGIPIKNNIKFSSYVNLVATVQPLSKL